MRTLLLASLALIFLAAPAWASRQAENYSDVAARPAYPIEIIAPLRKNWQWHHKRHYEAVERRSYGVHLVTVPTAAGVHITVAASVAGNFQGFIRGLVALGYHPRHIGCYSATGHIRNSLHHVGKACDFDQTGWNRAPAIMHTAQVTQLAHRWGFVSGCEFRSRRDCGHIGMDFSPARGFVHYASHFAHRHRRYAFR
jgi:hypothetical protein